MCRTAASSIWIPSLPRWRAAHQPSRSRPRRPAPEPAPQPASAPEPEPPVSEPEPAPRAGLFGRRTHREQAETEDEAPEQQAPAAHAPKTRRARRRSRCSSSPIRPHLRMQPAEEEEYDPRAVRIAAREAKAAARREKAAAKAAEREARRAAKLAAKQEEQEEGLRGRYAAPAGRNAAAGDARSAARAAHDAQGGARRRAAPRNRQRKNRTSSLRDPAQAAQACKRRARGLSVRRADRAHSGLPLRPTSAWRPALTWLPLPIILDAVGKSAYGHWRAHPAAVYRAIRRRGRVRQGLRQPAARHCPTVVRWFPLRCLRRCCTVRPSSCLTTRRAYISRIWRSSILLLYAAMREERGRCAAQARAYQAICSAEQPMAVYSHYDAEDDRLPRGQRPAV